METKTSNQISDIWQDAEKSRYGINILVVALVVTTGSIAAAYAAQLGDLASALVIFPSAISLILVMSLMPLKLITYVGTFALVMNFLIIAIWALTFN